MSLKNIDNNLDIADSILTKIGKILKKHWWVLITVLIAGFFYWALTLPENESYPAEDESYYQDSLSYGDSIVK